MQGFRIPTLAPAPGFGADLAVAHANGWENYDHYSGMASQFAAADIDATADALLRLFDNDDLRLRMGAAAQERACTVFDWKVVIGQYQALWSELAAIRREAPEKRTPSLNPWRPDPFALFAGYPTRPLDSAAIVSLTPGATVQAVQAMLQDATVAYAAAAILSAPEIATVVGAMLARGPSPAGAIAAVLSPSRRGVAERSLLWMAKFGFISISPWPQLADR